MSVVKVLRKEQEILAFHYEGPDWLPEKDISDFYKIPGLVKFLSPGRMYVQIVGSVTHGGPNQHGIVVRTSIGYKQLRKGDWIVREGKHVFLLDNHDFIEQFVVVENLKYKSIRQYNF